MTTAIRPAEGVADPAPLAPGRAAPQPALSPTALARRLGVVPGLVTAWLAAGLPVEDGGVDPIAACAWLGQGRLAEVPILARRWRRFLAVFSAHRRGRERTQRWRWARRHRFYGPDQPLRAVDWWLPDPPATAWQGIEQCTQLRVAGVTATVVRGGQRLHLVAPAPVITAAGAAEVAVAPRVDALSDHERRHLSAIVAAVVADFAYEFRRHDHAEAALAPRQRGSCLDLARCCQAAFTARGRPSRLCAGIVADDQVAGAHFWLEVAGPGAGWIALDPTPAAVAKLLGQAWDAWLSPWVGGLDARRIQLAAGAHPLAAEAAPVFIAAVPGEAWACDGDGRTRSAWACQDWVHGATAGGFERV